MIVFKAFFQIVKKNLSALIIYSVIFIGLVLAMSSNPDASSISEYQDAKMNITIIDRDNTPASQALENYLGTIHTLVDLPDDTETLQDELFYRNIDYILYIPEGFEENAASKTDTISLENVKVPDSVTGEYLDYQIESYLTIFKTYLAGGITITDAITYTNTDMKLETKIQIAEGKEESKPMAYYYYSYLCYIFIPCMINALSPVLIEFQKKRMLERTEVSSIRLRSKNLQLISAAFLLSIIFFAAFNLLAVILFKDIIFSEKGPWLMLNNTAVLAVTVAIAFLVGLLVKKKESTGMISNTVGLGMAFLCGVFVPQALMSTELLKFSRFLPFYWSIQVLDRLFESTKIDQALTQTMTINILIQLLFAAAIFTAGLAFTRYRKLHPTES